MFLPRSRFAAAMTVCALALASLPGRGGEAVQGSPAGQAPAAATHPDESAFREAVTPFLEANCYGCHGYGGADGGVSLDTLGGATDEKPAPIDAILAERTTWVAVWRNLRGHTMPPASEVRPEAAEQQRVQDWIARAVFRLDPANPDPGKPVLRRLNRHEYRQTVNDLLGIDYDTHEAFPPDDTGYGFDTVGEALAVSPLLVEKTHEAADEIASQVVARELGGGEPRRFVLAGALPDRPAERREAIAAALGKFAARAFRRPVEEETLAALVEIATGDGLEAPPGPGLERALAAILSSPRFLFRDEGPAAEATSVAGATSAPLESFALASRLSYFLWSTFPDERLTQLAASGELAAQFDTEVDRMVADGRSVRFVESFVGQWLATREVPAMNIDAYAVLGEAHGDPYERFNGEVRDGMKRETEALFAHVLAEDLAPTELLTARYTFLTPALAEFYGVGHRIPEGTGQWDVVRVELPPESHRRGVLTHGSFLVATSNPTRTSPVKRGLFVLDNVLGVPPPPPPPDVPDLESAKSATGDGATARQLMEAHRADPLCASCHARMDPIGLALEGYNAVGLFRADEGGKPIDTSGRLVTGEEFHSADELAEVLATSRRSDFLRCLTEKLLVYAVGRGVEYYDAPTVDAIVASMERDGGGLRRLLREVVASPAFQRVRLVEAEPQDAAPDQQEGT
ncbi:MAG: DUF1592 domain-containing protein [Lacipirellulaceae bacterium]